MALDACSPRRVPIPQRLYDALSGPHMAFLAWFVRCCRLAPVESRSASAVSGSPFWRSTRTECLRMFSNVGASLASSGQARRNASTTYSVSFSDGGWMF